MKIKHSRGLQLIVGLVTFASALAAAAGMSSSWIKWIVVVALVAVGVLVEWLIARFCFRIEQNERYYD